MLKLVLDLARSAAFGVISETATRLT